MLERMLFFKEHAASDEDELVSHDAIGLHHAPLTRDSLLCSNKLGSCNGIVSHRAL